MEICSACFLMPQAGADYNTCRTEEARLQIISGANFHKFNAKIYHNANIVIFAWEPQGLLSS